MFSDEPIEVLHVVGGDSALGGVMSYVRTLTEGSATNLKHYIWKSHRFSAPVGTRAEWVCEGRAKSSDLSIASDVVGAVRDLPLLASWQRRHPEAVFHAHSRLGQVASALLAWRTKTPLIMHMHARPKRTKIYHRLWRLSRAKVAFNSSATCRHFAHDPANSTILTPVIEWPSEPPLALRGNTPGVHFVASSLFVPWKNVHVIIEAFKMFAEQSKNAGLALFGCSSDGANSSYGLRLQVEASGHPLIRLMGWDPDWSSKLEARDIFVHAAKDEPFGIVMLEAFARGCRMVVPRNTFLDELPQPHDQAGIIRIDRPEAASLARAMQAVAQLPCGPGGLWAERQHIRASFSPRSANSRLSGICETIRAERKVQRA